MKKRKKIGKDIPNDMQRNYSRTSLSRMAKTQGICPGQRIIRDNELGFGAKQFRIQRISSGTARDSVE